jgi:hypothetical protein
MLYRGGSGFSSGGGSIISVQNVPVTSPVITGSLSQDIATLVPGTTYIFELKNALTASSGSISNYVEGWIKTDAVGGSIAVEGGQPVSVNRPVPICTITNKEYLYFILNPDTPFPCKIFVTVTSE